MGANDLRICLKISDFGPLMPLSAIVITTSLNE